MRSGMMRGSAPPSLSTPWIADGGVPAPSMLRAHLDEQIGQVHDFGLAGAVADNGFAFGQNGRHHEVFGAGYGDAVEVDVARRAGPPALASM